MLFQPLKPMLLSMGKEAFNDDKYIFEPKWDGFRILLHKEGDRIEAFTRNGNRITDKFPELKEIGDSVQAHSAIIDCEGICLRNGRPVFDDMSFRGRLTNAHKITTARQSHPTTFVAFDVLYTDGAEHTKEPLIERKKRLQDLIVTSPVIMPTLFVENEGIPLKALMEQQDMEGIVAKLKDSLYQLDTRTDNWIKIKNFKLIDTVILGYRLDPHFQLICGLHFPTVQNKPVAIVEWGFKTEEKLAFLEIAKQIHTKKDRQTQWIEPTLCCKIQYLERTENHQLRTTSFKGFLFDKKAEDCKWVS